MMERGKGRRSGMLDQRLIDSILSWRSQPEWSLDVPRTQVCAALMLVFQHFRVPIEPLVEVAALDDVGEATRHLGPSQLVAGREVRLEAGWWKSGGEVRIVEHEQLGVCALLPRSDHWIALEPGENGSVEHKVDRAFAEHCSPIAFEYMRVPPRGELTVSGLIQAAMFGLYPELLKRLLAAAANASLAIVPPVMVALLIDDVIPDGEISGLLGVAAALLVTIVANSLLLGIAGLAALRLDNALAYRMETIVFMRELDGRRGEASLSSGEVLQRVSAVNWAMGFIAKTTQTVMTQALRGVVNVALLFAYSTFFGAIAVATVLGCLFATGVEVMIQYRINKKAEAALGRAQEKSVQLLTGLDAARDRGIEHRLLGRWARDRAEYATLKYRSKSATNLRSGINVGIGSIGLMAVYAAAAWGDAGSLGTGEIVASIGAFTTVTISLKNIAVVLKTVGAVAPILSRLSPLIGSGEISRGRDRPPALVGGFRAEAVEVSRGGYRSRASFAIEPGSLTVLVAEDPGVGPHLLRVLSGLQKTEGVVQVDGLRLTSLDLALVRQEGNLLLNAPRVLPSTMRRNLDLDGEYTDEQILQAAEACGAGALLHDLPEGLDTVLAERGDVSGLATRLAAVRAQLNPARFCVVADHPEFKAAPWGNLFLQELLDREGTTRLLASTDPAVLARADRILVFDPEHGLVADGSPADLRAAPEALPEAVRDMLA